MFVGREEKLALLQHEHIGKAVMVYGKRRVGKTTLILKAQTMLLSDCILRVPERDHARKYRRSCTGTGSREGSARASCL